eukprot:TRINITY_DN27842_c0_g1_i1.p2 TRINITY_DN27842_c0_g1~~TRINITY_DN27842_c0_g1_i1.p2  ORF type:complete len:185 (-),score=53.30 TRINITY_DN27842_c0_g1_i1:184-714(-)
MELLERILRDCSLHDGACDVAALVPRAAAASAAPPAQVQEADVLLPWADEMVRQLQACASPEEARPRCAEVLAAFRRQQQLEASGAVAQAERLRILRGANGALLRGFRSLYQQGLEQDARRRCLEEANARLASELAACQESLETSERARGALQYHLQLTALRGSDCGSSSQSRTLE